MSASGARRSRLASFGQIHMRVAGTLNPHGLSLASSGDFLTRIPRPCIPVQPKSGSFGASSSPSFVFQTAYCRLPPEPAQIAIGFVWSISRGVSWRFFDDFVGPKRETDGNYSPCAHREPIVSRAVCAVFGWMREIRKPIESMGAPKCLSQQRMEVFPKFNFGMVLFRLTPLSNWRLD